MAKTDEAQVRTSAGWFGALAAVSAAGVGISVYLTRLHLDLFYGTDIGGSLCDIGEHFNCSAVNASPESEIAGIPQALLAIPVYLLTLGLGLWGWRARDGRAATVVTGIGLVAVLYSARLAYISATVIGAWCLFCMALYAINLAILGLGAWAGRGVKLGAALVPGVVSALVGVALLGGSWLSYDRVRVEMAAVAAAAATKATAPEKPAKTAATSPEGAAPGSESKKVKLGVGKEVVPPPKAPGRGAPKASAKVTIVEFSDFQCPFCKRLAGSLHQLVDEYPKDVRLVYAQFPLNLDCNKSELKRTMHPEACNAGAASHCADAQGKFWEMHDALFESQAELGKKFYSRTAKNLGLDVAAFEACMADPATMSALAEDTVLGGSLGVSGTPTFFVNGRVMSGAQPIEVLRAVVDAEIAGNKAALDLDVKVGVETVGEVSGPATVAVAGLSGVSIDAFEASLDGSRAVSKPGVEPARSISWYDADKACKAAGHRLCTEREWLAACTGQPQVDVDSNGIASDDTITGRRYGYGDARRSGACADSRNPDAPGDLRTGVHPQCGTPEGAYDLVGGVKEWVGLTPASAAVKGGSYSSGESARCGYYRDDIAADVQDAATGFRCCDGPPDPAPAAVIPGRDVGETLAPFEVPLVDGTTLSSRKLAGKPTVISFWASWCGPCQKEIPALANLYERYKVRGLQVLAISVDEDTSKLTTWLGAHPLPFLVGHDVHSALMNSFPNRGLPTTLWIKRDGVIRLRTTGVPPGGEKRLEELVVELVGGDPIPDPAAARPAPTGAPSAGRPGTPTVPAKPAGAK